MAEQGEIGPMPDIAIFADVDEPTPVREHLERLRFRNTPNKIPIVFAKKRDLYSDIMSAAMNGDRVSNPPFFTDTGGKKGMLLRGCTRDYKIRVIKAKARQIYEGRFGKIEDGCIEQWIGISADEKERWTKSDVNYITHRHPFLGKLETPRAENALWITRGDCKEWLERNGYPIPPKSACTFCPFHSNAEWRWLKENDQAGWDRAIRVDRAIRNGLPGVDADRLFVHPSLTPLEDADLRDEAESVGQRDMFARAECSGMCGV